MGNGNSGQARIDLPKSDTMSAEQMEVYNAVISGPRGTVVGPLRAALLNPVLADRWQKFGETLRYNTGLPKRISELAIIATARRWNSDLEWIIHAKAALEGGLPDDVVTAIQRCESPSFKAQDEAEVYEFARQILETGKVEENTYDQVKARWGDIGVVELTAVVGYYSMVAMTLNAHQIPLPNDVAPIFDNAGQKAQLTTLPAGTSSQ